MQYKVLKNGEIRVLSKNSTRPKFKMFFDDFFTSQMILNNSEKSVFMAMCYKSDKNVIEMTRSTVKLICQMSCVHYRSVYMALRGLRDKGFICRGKDMLGEDLESVYVINPYLYCYRSDASFLLKHNEYETIWDNACLTIVDLVSEKLSDYASTSKSFKKVNDRANVKTDMDSMVDPEIDEDFE